MYDFFLISDELACGYEPRGCNIIRKLMSKGKSYAYVAVEPAIPGEVYGLESDIERLILSSRDPFTSVLRIWRWQWPVIANIGFDVEVVISENGRFDVSESLFVDIGVLFKNLEEATAEYENQLKSVT